MAISAETLQGLLVTKLESLNSDYITAYNRWLENPVGDAPAFPDTLGAMSDVINEYLNDNIEVHFLFSGTNAATGATETNVQGQLGITGVNFVLTKTGVATPAANKLFITTQFVAGMSTGIIVPDSTWELTPLPFSSDPAYLTQMSITFGTKSSYTDNMLELAQSVCDSVKTKTSALTYLGTHTVGVFVGSAKVTEIK